VKLMMNRPLLAPGAAIAGVGALNPDLVRMDGATS
jgi:hypothetical protein